MRSSSEGSGTSLAPVCGTGWSKPSPNMVLGASSRLSCPSHLLLVKQGTAWDTAQGSAEACSEVEKDLRDGAAHLPGARKLQSSNGPSPRGSHPMLSTVSARERWHPPSCHSLLYQGPPEHLCRHTHLCTHAHTSSPLCGGGSARSQTGSVPRRSWGLAWPGCHVGIQGSPSGASQEQENHRGAGQSTPVP